MVALCTKLIRVVVVVGLLSMRWSAAGLENLRAIFIVFSLKIYQFLVNLVDWSPEPLLVKSYVDAVAY